jgi:ubiquinone/menaquinone biosynthesis C-methylase UbiE
VSSVDDRRSTNGEDEPAAAAMLRLIMGFWISRAVYIAARLGIADLLEDGPLDIERIASATASHGPSLYRVLRTLASVGVLVEDGQRRFSLTPVGATLRTGVPGSLRAWVNVQLGDEHYRAWGRAEHSVRTGESAFDHVLGMGVWQYRAQHSEHAKLFDEAMANLTAAYHAAVVSSYSFAPFDTIVDVGGGDGGLLVAILEANPTLHGVLFDLPHVARKATRRLAEAGLTGRCEVVAGDAFSSVPEGADAYILSRVIHDWDDARSIAILRNCHRAMAATGTLLLVEGVVRHGNEPDLTKLFDLNMMVLAGGCERTAAEYQALLEAAGFAMAKIIPTASVMGVSVIEGIRAGTRDVAPKAVRTLFTRPGTPPGSD